MSAKSSGIMNKPLPGGVVAVVLTLLAVIVGVLGWKYALAPPAPNPVIPMTREQFQEVLRQNADSVGQIVAEQRRLYAAVHHGELPGAAQTKGGYLQVVHPEKQAAGKGR
jgi:hypothetical protein